MPFWILHYQGRIGISGHHDFNEHYRCPLLCGDWRQSEIDRNMKIITMKTLYGYNKLGLNIDELIGKILKAKSFTQTHPALSKRMP